MFAHLPERHERNSRGLYIKVMATPPYQLSSYCTASSIAAKGPLAPGSWDGHPLWPSACPPPTHRAGPDSGRWKRRHGRTGDACTAAGEPGRPPRLDPLVAPPLTASEKQETLRQTKGSDHTSSSQGQGDQGPSDQAKKASAQRQEQSHA
jgi:hypothetical protein